MSNDPLRTATIDIGLLSDGMLHNWIKKYLIFIYSFNTRWNS